MANHCDNCHKNPFSTEIFLIDTFTKLLTDSLVEYEHVKVGLYGLLRTLRWITKISILQAEEQMLD